MILDHWSNLLHYLKFAAPEAHIGGGAVRDYLLSRPIKDLDIFISVENEPGVDHRLRAMGYMPGRRVGGTYISDEIVAQAVDYAAPIPGGHPVNVIALHDHTNVGQSFQRFDFGITRAAFDGDNIITTKAFELDRIRRAFTLLRADNADQFRRSMDRFKRFQVKYEGWQLVIPEEFHDLAVEYAAPDWREQTAESVNNHFTPLA